MTIKQLSHHITYNRLNNHDIPIEWIEYEGKQFYITYLSFWKRWIPNMESLLNYLNIDILEVDILKVRPKLIEQPIRVFNYNDFKTKLKFKAQVNESNRSMEYMD